MKCPSCRTTLTAPAERCPDCKFALRNGDTKFGRPPLHSRYLTDRTGRLALKEMAKLRGQLEIFDKKFPQSLFSVFITELSPGSLVSEYTFWLANRARFSTIEAVESENFDLLLVIDAQAGAAAFTTGYGLEKYLPESDLKNILAVALPEFREGNLAEGIRICIDRTIDRLREISKQAERDTTSAKRIDEIATTQTSVMR